MKFHFPAVHALIVTLLLSFVNGSAHCADFKIDAKEFKSFIQELLKTGQDDKMDVGRGKFLGVEAGASEKAIDVDLTEEFSRSCELVVDSSGKQRPVCLILRTSRSVGREAQEYYFRLSLKGKIEKIVFARGVADGAPGTGKSEEIDIKKPGIRESLQQELDYWLKGTYRKELALAKAAEAKSKNAGPVDAAQVVKDTPSPEKAKPTAADSAKK